jgi:hypothetical protein
LTIYWEIAARSVSVSHSVSSNAIIAGVTLAFGFNGPQRDEVFAGKERALPHSDGNLSANLSKD